MKLLTVAAGVLVIAAGSAWFATRQPRHQAEHAPSAEAREAAPPAGEFPRSAKAGPAEEEIRLPEQGSELVVNAPVPPPLPLNITPPAWEEQLNSLRTDAGKSESAKARDIFAMMPALPEEALAEAAEQAVERIPDADYVKTVLPVVTNPATHHRATSVLFADLMERPDAITLPALLQIARNSGHAFAPSAQDNLRLLLNADYGTDWSRWEAEIRRVLVRSNR